MKNVFAVLVVMGMLLTMVACAAQPPQVSQAPAPAAGQPAAQEVDEAAGADAEQATTQVMRKDNVLKYANWSAIVGAFHPDFAIGAGQDVNITDVLYEPLVRIGLNNKLEGVLAESWEISEDSKTVTFHLRQGVKWHDGEDFTAEDVKFTYESNATNGYTGFFAGNVRQIVGYEEFNAGTADSLAGIEIIDDHTIKITTKEVYGPFMHNIGEQLEIVPKHKWESIPAAQRHEATEELRTPIGTGPFKFKEFVVDQYVMLEKFEDYWNGTPKIDGILYSFMNPDTAQAAALNGDLDMMQISNMNPDDIQAYEDAGFTLQELWWTSIQYVVTNNENPLLADRRVRQAFAHAIDRQGIADGIFNGYARVENSPYASTQWGAPDPADLNPYEYDPQKAIDILTNEVGWEYRDGVMYANGERVALELMVPTGNRSRERASTVIQQNLREIGVDITLTTMEMATQVGRFREGNFDMGMIGNGSQDPDLSWLFMTGAPNNYQRHSSARMDELLQAGASALTQEERQPIYEEFGVEFNKEWPMIPLVSWADGLLIPPGLVGVVAEDAAYWKWYDLQNWYFTNIAQ